jgi:DNA invertase Pin-like site-specific DNA recombinase
MPKSRPARSGAVAYLRRSTDRQERSLDDQLAAIHAYAVRHGLAVLRIYTDDAISGVRSDTRGAFQSLIRDAQSRRCDFGTVLVYDLKRFGRVDNDEAGHYRWLLRKAGVQVVYVAEAFGGGSLDDLIRPVKQWQAREEARDLAKVTIRGLLSKIKRDQALGFWLGGYPPYGYDLRYETAEGRFRYVVRYLRDGSKQLLTEDGAILASLRRREAHVVTKDDRCRLVLSAPERVEAIRRIFRSFVSGEHRPGEIAKLLNSEGVPTARGPEWSALCHGVWHPVTVQNILRNPTYMGDLVWNRRTLAKFYKIGPQGALEREDVDLRRTCRNDVDLWIRAPGTHAGIVDRATWNQAQIRLRSGASG